MADRRTFLRGLAVAPLAAAPLAVLPAQASPAMSDEAAALLAEFHDIAGRYNAAGERLDKISSATARIPEPEELFAKEHDFWVLGCIPPQRHWRSPRFSYDSDDLIAQLRALHPGDGDRKRADRRDEIVGAWDRWHADKKAAEIASGEAAASDHYRAVGEEHDAFVRRLVLMRTADPDIMKVKAALVLNAWVAVDRFDRAVTRIMENSEEFEDALSISLMRDLMHQLGAEHRVKA